MRVSTARSPVKEAHDETEAAHAGQLISKLREANGMAATFTRTPQSGTTYGRVCTAPMSKFCVVLPLPLSGLGLPK